MKFNLNDILFYCYVYPFLIFMGINFYFAIRRLLKDLEFHRIEYRVMREKFVKENLYNEIINETCRYYDKSETAWNREKEKKFIPFLRVVFCVGILAFALSFFIPDDSDDSKVKKVNAKSGENTVRKMTR